jgi:hypothetical protein
MQVNTCMSSGGWCPRRVTIYSDQHLLARAGDGNAQQCQQLPGRRRRREEVWHLRPW